MCDGTLFELMNNLIRIKTDFDSLELITSILIDEYQYKEQQEQMVLVLCLYLTQIQSASQKMERQIECIDEYMRIQKK